MSATVDEFRWLLDGEVGSSSMTIWHVMTGEPMKRGWSPRIPLDPDDLRRCLLLLERFPVWTERLPEVAARYPEWRRLVEEWASLADQLRSEVARTPGLAVDTYKRMKAMEAP